MPHIELPVGIPGIGSLIAYRPETGGVVGELGEVLLRGPSPLSRGERELIAAHVSALNECVFCHGVHSACAARQLPGGREVVDQVGLDPETADVSPKMRALLAIAGLVQQSGRAVSKDAVARARSAGASDVEIHDTVLIAAAFCMFNRYVDGLATVTPADPAAYEVTAARLVERGYVG
jgi:uncharacterized peroxidase-related enzyme